MHDNIRSIIRIKANDKLSIVPCMFTRCAWAQDVCVIKNTAVYCLTAPNCALQSRALLSSAFHGLLIAALLISTLR